MNAHEFQSLRQQIGEALDALAPPVNVRAEQVHRIRQHLVNMRASCGTSLDDIDLETLGVAIDDLIALERDLRDSADYAGDDPF
jgi:hypothetical protein